MNCHDIYCWNISGYKESSEELQAALVTKSLEEGRTLLDNTNNRSLAAEFEAMSENEVNKNRVKLYLFYMDLTKKSFYVANR